MKEQPQWRNVVGYEGLYEVSSTGEVRNARTLVVLKQSVCNGYRRVNLWKGNKYKTKKVHRLVAEAFIENHLGKRTVNHIDGDKTNNSVENLDWATYGENTKHAYDLGLNAPSYEAAVSKRRKKVSVDGVVYVSLTAAAKALGCCITTITEAIKQGKKVRGHSIERVA